MYKREEPAPEPEPVKVWKDLALFSSLIIQWDICRLIFSSHSIIFIHCYAKNMVITSVQTEHYLSICSIDLSNDVASTYLFGYQTKN